MDQYVQLLIFPGQLSRVSGFPTLGLKGRNLRFLGWLAATCPGGDKWSCEELACFALLEVSNRWDTYWSNNPNSFPAQIHTLSWASVYLEKQK